MNNTIKKPGQFKAYLSIAWHAFKAQTRNPASFFFGFVFPVVFISIFGLIGNNPQPINVGIVDNVREENPVQQVLEKQDFIKTVRGSRQEQETQLAQGKLASVVILDRGSNSAEIYRVTIINSSGMPQESSTITGLVSNIVDKTNLRLSGVNNPPVAFSVEQIAGRKPRYIDFALPGQIGFALLSTALFGTVFGLIYLKKTGILKRMFATPTKPLTILLAQGTSRLLIALMQTILVIAFGVFVFKFYLPHGFTTFLEIIFLSALGLTAFLGFGYFIAGLANDENSAGPLTNLVSLPQFLLSGTFFPVESLPRWLQPVANNLPLSYFNHAIRKVTTEAGGLSDTVPYLLGLAVWGMIMYLLAAKTFRWE